MNCNFAAFIKFIESETIKHLLPQCHTVGLRLEHILEILFKKKLNSVLLKTLIRGINIIPMDRFK